MLVLKKVCTRRSAITQIYNKYPSLFIRQMPDRRGPFTVVWMEPCATADDWKVQYVRAFRGSTFSNRVSWLYPRRLKFLKVYGEILWVCQTYWANWFAWNTSRHAESVLYSFLLLLLMSASCGLKATMYLVSCEWLHWLHGCGTKLKNEHLNIPQRKNNVMVWLIHYHGGDGTYDLYCSQPPGGDRDVLVHFWGAVIPSIFIYSLWFEQG